jgi:cell wall-associated NlpC family hydrolase
MKKTFAVALAALLLSVPLGACSENADSYVPEKEEEIDIPALFPEDIPEEAPPVEGETPAEPEQPDQSEEPDPPAAEDPLPEPEPEPEPEPPKPVKAQYVYVHHNGVNVRAGAGTAHTSLGTVEKDVLLKYTGKVGDWYETYYKGRTAYISANTAYTSVTVLDKGEEDVENVIDEGLRRLGVPYVYGAVRLHDGKGNFLKGFTVKQFDCSSLMQYIFYEGAGVLLNTTTRTQVSQGQPVKKENLKRGDLMFFTNASRYNKTGVERIGHVALYLGENYILHTASDYAKIEQISATRWSYYITSRRVL